MATSLYTKTGDEGLTGLFGGQRVRKDDLRIETYGTIDELNAVLGLALSVNCPQRLAQPLTALSSLLFTAGSDLATPLDPPPSFAIPRIESRHSAWLESLIDEYDAELDELKAFILPGGTQTAAYLHLARTVCRRAERCCVSLAAREDIGKELVIFLNRCSDYLFIAARMANHVAGVADVPWQKEQD